MNNEFFYSRNRTNVSPNPTRDALGDPRAGGVIAKLLLLLTAGVVLTVASFFVFPGFWRARLADYLLGDETVDAPETDATAASAAQEKLDAIKSRIQRLEVLPADAPESTTLTKLEIDSYIYETHRKLLEDADKDIPVAADEIDREKLERARNDIVQAMDNLQIELREDAFVVLGNVDFGKLSGLFEERTGEPLPEEFQRHVGFSSEYRLVTRERVVDFEMQELILGQTSLKDSLLAPLLEEMRDKIDEFVESKIQGVIGEEFERTSDTGLSFRLPDEIDDIKVSPDGIKIRYAPR